MDAVSYAALTQAMDSFDVRHAHPKAGAHPQMTFVGITSDRLFRPVARRNARVEVIAR
jgi:homoserine acetyltransferase